MKNLILESKTFTLFGYEIAWYGVIVALGMLMGVVCAIIICKKKKYDFSIPINLALWALPLAIVGARIYYCILHGVSDFWQIFRIWDGGMAIYGGVIGGFLGVVICCKIHKYSLLEACDLAAPCLLLGQAIGRIGCYFGGCCYGIETTNEALMKFPFSVQIMTENGLEWHLATFFYEAFFNLIGFIVLMILTFKVKKKGIVTASYLIIYGTVRAVLEYFRDPAESLMLGNTGIKASMLLSIILAIVGIVILCLAIYFDKKRRQEVNEQL